MTRLLVPSVAALTIALPAGGSAGDGKRQGEGPGRFWRCDERNDTERRPVLSHNPRSRGTRIGMTRLLVPSVAALTIALPAGASADQGKSQGKAQGPPPWAAQGNPGAGKPQSGPP